MNEEISVEMRREIRDVRTRLSIISKIGSFAFGGMGLISIMAYMSDRTAALQAYLTENPDLVEASNYVRENLPLETTAMLYLGLGALTFSAVSAGISKLCDHENYGRELK